MTTFFSNSSSLEWMECPCPETFKGRKVIGKPGCSADDIAVAVLPDDWVPRRSGPILANYLKHREMDHNKIHKEIVKCAADANSEINSKIRRLAEVLMAHVNQNQLEMDCIVVKWHTKNAVLTKEACNDTIKQIKELSLLRIQYMAAFKQEASALEKERADNVKAILRDNFHRLVTLGHLSPKELLHDFDTRIYGINQQLLSNSRAFEELEAQLRYQLDQNVINARTSLNQLTLGISVCYRSRKAHSALRRSIHESISQRPFIAFKNLDVAMDKTIYGAAEKLEECVARIVDMYRSAVLTVYTGIYGLMENLQDYLGYHRCVFKHNTIHERELPDFESLIDRLLSCLSTFCKQESATHLLLKKTEPELLAMQNSLRSLGECLIDTYSVLHYAGHLSDGHILRCALAQKLTIAAVEDLLTSNDRIELANEIPISIALEQLRCAPNEVELDRQYNAIVLMLTKTAEMYLHHSKAELKRLDEFMNLPTTMTNTLLSEFNLFLAQCPRSGPINEMPSTPPSRSMSFFQLPLPRAVLQTVVQELALQNWRNGFLESFKGNMSIVPEELNHQAQMWVEERSTPLHMRYSLKLISHSIRLERVKAAKEERLAELRQHKARLESHLQAVYHVVTDLPVQASEFAAIDDPFLYPLVSLVQQTEVSINKLMTQEAMDPATKDLHLSSFALRLRKYRELYEDSLDKAIPEYKLYLERSIQEVRISNVRFVSQICLFSEGGRYAAAEAVEACSLLVKAFDALEICTQKSLDALNIRRSLLLANADKYVQPLMALVQGKTTSSKKMPDKPDGNKSR